MHLGNKPTEQEHIGLEGLDTRAEIVVDNWGIPHIRAGSLRDLFFAQGFDAARDRLWQIDLWRKRELGRLAADFGPGYLAQGRAAQLFTYRGDMDAEWAAYSPDAKDICTAFTAGISAFIALTEREPDRLPPEFIEPSQPAKRKSSGKPPSRSVSGQDPTVRVTLDTILGNIELTEGVGAGGELPGTGRAWEGHDILVCASYPTIVQSPPQITEEQIGQTVDSIRPALQQIS